MLLPFDWNTGLLEYKIKLLKRVSGLLNDAFRGLLSFPEVFVAVVLTPVEEMTTLVCLGLQKDVQINSEGALPSFNHSE